MKEGAGHETVVTSTSVPFSFHLQGSCDLFNLFSYRPTLMLLFHAARGFKSHFLSVTVDLNWLRIVWDDRNKALRRTPMLNLILIVEIENI